MKRKTKFWLGFFTGMLATAIVVVSAGAGYFISMAEKNTSASEGAYGKLKSIEGIVDSYYLDEIDRDAMKESIYKGLMQGLGDPYSTYYTKAEYDTLLEEQSGVYSGIGAMVTQNKDTSLVSVVKVFEGSPAANAGIVAEDIIYKIDDKEVYSLPLDDIVSEMKGKPNTKVKVTVYRASSKEYLDFEITRAQVDVPTVAYNMVDEKNKIGYIQVTEFDQNTPQQFKVAIETLTKDGMKSVIFDLRNNPGGLLNSVCEMLDYILPEGTLVYTMDKHGNKDEKKSDANYLNMPMIVLQNENSASASEIFAGAVQDFKKATVIGTQSFGKGIVQSLLPLSDGSALKITVEKYYTPNGVNIHGTGITPDLLIEDDKATEVDEQLNKGIETLGGKVESEEVKADDSESDQSKSNGKKDKSSEKKNKNSKTDKKDKSSKTKKNKGDKNSSKKKNNKNSKKSKKSKKQK